MLRFPRLDTLDRQHKIGILGGICARVYDTGGADKVLCGQGIRRIVRQFPPCDPMYRRIKVRAGMLTEMECVPIPGWPGFVVIGDALNSQRGRLLKNRREDNNRGLRRKRLSQINHSHLPTLKRIR